MAKDNGQLVAILSYITVIGWIVALILNNQKKTPLGSYHLRQALLLYITWFVLLWIPIIGWLLNVVIFIFTIMGVVYAIQKKQQPVPLLGPLAQQWFKTL